MDELLYMCGVKLNRGGFIFSPGRNEKTPSCKIYSRDNRFHDYSTDKGGDVIDLYALFYNLNTETAINELYKVAGGEEFRRNRKPVNTVKKVLENPGERFTAQEKECYFERLGITGSETEALNAVKQLRISFNSEIFRKLHAFCLKEGWSSGAWKYITDTRKISEAAVDKFRLFYIKDYPKVSGFLTSKWNKEELTRAGLVSDSGNLIFYKHRIIIPYLHRGEIVYLRGRYYDPDHVTPQIVPPGGNKYFGLRDDGLGVNTARRFFNMDVLKGMRQGERLYLVEGEFDTIVMDQLGYNVIGIPGTGTVNLEKLDRLKDYEIHIIGDNDKAGNKLLGKIIRKFSEMGKSVIQKKLPTGIKDITDFVIQVKNNGK